MLKSLTLANFVQLIVNSNEIRWSSNQLSDHNLVDIQAKLLELAVDRGANLNKVADDLPTHSIAVILELYTKQLTPDNLLKIAFKTTDKGIKEQSALIQTCIEKGAKLEKLLSQGNFYHININTLDYNKELFIENSSINVFAELVWRVSHNTDDNAIKKTELLKFVIENGVDLNKIVAQGNTIPLKELIPNQELLIANLTPQNFLTLALVYNYNNDLFKQQSDLIKQALDRGADLNIIIANVHHYSTISIIFLDSFKELFINNLTPDNFLLVIFRIHDAFTAKLEQKRFELLELAVENGADLNKLLSDESTHLDIKLINAQKTLFFSHATPQILLKYILRPNYDAPPEDKEIQAALVKTTLENGADIMTKINFGFFSEKATILDIIFVKGLFNIIDLAIDSRPEKVHKISSEAYFVGVAYNFNLEFAINAIQRFSDSFNQEAIFESARANGMSHIEIQSAFDLYYLAKDFLSSRSLNDAELSLLDKNKESLTLESYKNIKPDNIYNYTSLQLALIGGKWKLAGQMIEQGFDLTAKNNNGITAVHIIGKIITLLRQYTGELAYQIELVDLVLKNLDNVDVILNAHGESLVDSFLRNEQMRDEVLEKSHDPLYAFFKKNVDLMSPMQEPEKIHIAISHGEGFWSTGVDSWSRIISNNNSNVVFHLVTLEMIQRGGDKFITQFNGWINPGAGDSFPGGKAEFTLKDTPLTMIIEQTYQKVLEKTFEFNIPYLGMCAGAQHFALHHEGTLYPLEGYGQGHHHIHYLKGTLPYFMTLTKTQQQAALKSCEFPEVMVKGDTAHHYAAVTYKLGEDIQLGAISEDGVAMSYGHKDAELGKCPHPKDLFFHIAERLNECSEAPVCLIGESIFANFTINECLLESKVDL